MRTSMVAFASIALAACAKTNAPPADTTASSSAMMPAASNDDAKAAIGKLRDAWVAAANAKNSAAVGAMYTDDAVLAGTTVPVTNGRAAIEKVWADAFPIASNLKVNSEKTEVSGDMAYDYGTYSQHIAPPKGKAMEDTGRYLVVFKRQADGSWKIAAHVGVTPAKS
jgi:uncharacterized protein (TIGR02246 family)